MRIEIPEFAMVALIGTSGCGKSTFARKHFLPSETLSSDAFRELLFDDETILEHNDEVFDALQYMLAKRLKHGRLTVVDATNVQAGARKPLLEISSRWHALKVAIVFDIPIETCVARNEARENRNFGAHVIHRMRGDLRKTFGQLKGERWHKVYILSPEQVEAAEVVREPILSRKLDQHGPFDIIGDVHGCSDEFFELLTKLGYPHDPAHSHPEGRRLILLGDLVDRGPDPVGVLRFAIAAVRESGALWTPGNHDIRLARSLMGKKTSVGHGLEETLAAVRAEPPEFAREVAEFIEGLVSHAVLDDWKLVVAHAGMVEEMQGRGSRAVREFALFGEATGEIDEFGLPIRYEWARNYRGKALVAYGHTPVPEAEFYNNTIDLDTGCCFGGALSALRYPEREIVGVPAKRVYCEPVRPLVTAPVADDGMLDVQDVLGRRMIETSIGGRITIAEENAIAALEVMSRFAADPRWLIYLPPTMSPCAASEFEDYLEYPTEAFSYFRNAEVQSVICQEKHMGSRAMAVVCRSEEVARTRFGVEGELGALLTRTGRRFFEDLNLEQGILRRLATAAEQSGLFAELDSNWLLLDLELMPWSAKASGLLQDQYAPVAAASEALAESWRSQIAIAARRGIEGLEAMAQMSERRFEAASGFRAAYRRYCWTVDGANGLRLAPFHLLSSETGPHFDKPHAWHLEHLDRLCQADPELLQPTNRLVVRLDSDEEIQAGIRWWCELVGAGGEGMVVKPSEFVIERDRRLVQPAVKCRGPEYLRLIYGPEYRQPENLSRLRKRGLNRKRSLATREFALGHEALARFAKRDSLRRVHECVFAVLALESEPVDPRL